jgi:N-acetylated-alpha-linked acidic dipeptidase
MSSTAHGPRTVLVIAATLPLLVCCGCGGNSTSPTAPRPRETNASLATPRIPGVAAARLAAQRDAERRFMEAVSVDEIGRIHRLATARPHIAGTPASLALADLLRAELARAGLQAEAHDYRVHLSTPRRVDVAITAPVSERLVTREPVDARDPDSSHPDLGPAFVAYSAIARVAAPVVYVNYGLPPDYARLAAAGVDVKGHIVIARYARSHRAVKIHTAEQQGAAGIIIYSDPADDGFARGLVWPEGPWRADFQSQSGNGKYSWFWHGDALTPGVAATGAATRLDAAAAPTLPRIPAVVLSSREAQKILSKLGGPAAPGGFQGGLPFTYRTGPGRVIVEIDVDMDAGPRTIRNVVARIPGRDSSRQVLLGTHHDAWTFGGMDPGSGLSAVFETARALAALATSGWTPERDLVFAFWDAEEFGLIGSTEHAEAFQQRLREQTVTYINTDLFMKGRFDGGGTPSLRDFLVSVTRDVPAYSGSGSVYDGWRADLWRRQTPERRSHGPEGFEVDLAALGSGADFVAFQDFLGLPTLQMEFDFEGSYGPYHSNYDTRQFVERLSDPGFAVARTLTQVLGLAMMRLGSADILPLRYSHYGRLIRTFLATADGWARDEDGRVRVTMELDEARRIVDDIEAAALALEARIDRQLESGATPSDARALNDQLVRIEQTLLDESPPPDRRWYRHVIYGWNIYSLYEGQPLPGLAEATRLADQVRVGEEVARLTAALGRMRDGLAVADVAAGRD